MHIADFFQTGRNTLSPKLPIPALNIKRKSQHTVCSLNKLVLTLIASASWPVPWGLKPGPLYNNAH